MQPRQSTARIARVRTGNLFIVSGPSGAGKGTLVRELVHRVHDAWVSVSVTTRPPRLGEMDGQHYHFISDEEFDRLVAAGGMLDVRRGQRPVPEETALDLEVRVDLGELPQGLGHEDGVAVAVPADEGDGGRADQHLLDVQAEVPGGEAHQGVLVDGVLGTGLTQCITQDGHAGDVDPSVIGEHGSIGVAEA